MSRTAMRTAKSEQLEKSGNLMPGIASEKVISLK
jgi:hypothetical protein